MKKDDLNSKRGKKKNKKHCSIDTDTHNKYNNCFYQKLAENAKKSNQNITHINNINIVNMIMSKDKSYKNNNMTINNEKSKRNKYKKIDRSKRSNSPLLIDLNSKINSSIVSREDLPKVKKNKILLYSSRNDSKSKWKSKKKNGIVKADVKNQSCRHLNNKFKLFEKNYNKKDKFTDNIKRYLNIFSQYKKNVVNLKGKKKGKAKSEEEEDSFFHYKKIYTYHNSYHNSKKNIKTVKKVLNRSSDVINELKQLDHTDSDVIFKNKLKKEDYNKDIDYPKIKMPYPIRVNIVKKLDDMKLNNDLNTIQKTNNESYINLNESTARNENTDKKLKQDNNINFTIKKSNLKNLYGNKKKIYFDNDDEIINFVKNKFKEKSCKYLSELQSKNYITNIFGNNNDKSKKNKKNLYTGCILTKKVKGKKVLAIELNSITGIEAVNKLLKEEKFEINNDQIVLTTSNYLLQLKEEKKNIKLEFKKLKDEYKNVCLNAFKLKEENNFTKLKFVKLKNDYNNIVKELSMVSSRNKELVNEISKKDAIIKKYEKNINQNQDKIKNIEESINRDNNIKNLKNNVYLINKEIDFNIIKKVKNIKLRNKKEIVPNNNNISLKNKFKNIKIEKMCNFYFDKSKNLNNETKIIKKDNEIPKNCWIDKNIIKIQKESTFDYISCNINKNKAFNNKILIIKNENYLYINNNNIKAKNDIKLKTEKICSIKFDGIEEINIDNQKVNNNNNEIKRFNDNLIKEQINVFNIQSYKKEKNINELTLDLNSQGKEKVNSINKNLVMEQTNNIHYEETKNEKKIKNINTILNIDKNQYLFYEGKKIEKRNIYNMNFEKNINLFFGGVKKKNENYYVMSLENNINLCFGGVKKKNENYYAMNLENNINLFFAGAKKKNENYCVMSFENNINLFFTGAKKKNENYYVMSLENNINLFFGGVKKKNENYCAMNLENNINLFFGGVKKKNENYYAMNLENNINLFFGGMKKNMQYILYLEKACNLYFGGNPIIPKNDNLNLQREQVNNIYYDKIKKIINLFIEKNDLFSFETIKKENKNVFEMLRIENISLINNNYIRKFNNNSIETIELITLESKKSKIQGINNNNQIGQVISFTLANTIKSNYNKQFSQLEISKDIKNSIFLEGIEDLQDSFSIDYNIYETPMRKKSSNSNIHNVNNITSISKFNEKKEDNNEIKNKKEARESRALSRIRKRNKSQKAMPTFNQEIMNSKENIENTSTFRQKTKYRQSFKIMEIAKKLEKEITKQDKDDKLDSNRSNKDNIDEFTPRESSVVGIISNKPTIHKKKKSKRVSFIE